MKRPDVIVVGLGAMGSAAAYQLTRRGLKVLGLDRDHPPHTNGSSHGLSRIIREAYYEHPLYVPLVQRAYQAWAKLEERSGRRLLTVTGGLMIGRPDGTLVAGARRSAVDHALPYEELSAKQIRQRFPGFHLATDEVGLLEPRAGVLNPEECIRASLEQARLGGAELRLGETVSGWDVKDGFATVTTEGDTYQAKHLVLAAGSWMAGALPKTRLGLSVERQVLFWFAPTRAGGLGPGELPIFIWEWAPDRFIYGFPDLGDGVKVARHHEGEPADPDRPRRAMDALEEAGVRKVLSGRLPEANGPLLQSAVCLYTNSPDGHFTLGPHPEFPQVFLVSPCSGHGFKFASVIGEIVADLVTEGGTTFDLSPFRVGRGGGMGE
ncbi:MAG TPA: N-methyl-L-tryptophan oxidase [Gemmatimonadales bacterium]|jgi:sarcosine oxidase|nr:N-methyl-L-tryptophan oxidase [Gemmatimonadales bacterium]